MTYFSYLNQQLYVENFSLQQLAAEFGTPCYVYSKAALENSWQQYSKSLAKHGSKHKLFYAVKANSNLAILNVLTQLGAGFDAVSGGEIERILAAGGKADKIVFSGVGKSLAEISMAIDLEIYSINVESTAELIRINAIAQQKNKVVNIAIRVNPDISANSHPYISTGSKQNKFGIAYTEALGICQQAYSLENINLKGLTCHIGSQITSMQPFLSAVDQLLALIAQLTTSGIEIQYLDIGGGLGVRYKDESPPLPEEYIDAIMSKISDKALEIHFEPGRSIVANAGILLTKVEYIKNSVSNNFCIVDAAMNDLIRPALYQSFHDIVAVNLTEALQSKEYAIVGPVCESGDFFAKSRSLAVKEGDLLAIKSAGAYGFSMSSNYNTRPRCAEVLVDNTKAYLIRERETVTQLMQNERLPNAARYIPSRL